LRVKTRDCGDLNSKRTTTSSSLFEEVTLLMNSGLIRKPVAHYMFGYYAIRCWESENFWSDVNRDSPYWAALRTFVDEMKNVEDGFEVQGVTSAESRLSQVIPYVRRNHPWPPPSVRPAMPVVDTTPPGTVRPNTCGYTDRLADAGIEPSVGSRGDSYDNALAESIIGLYKTEVIQRQGPWRHLEGVEFATLDWVDWFNTRRLLEPIGYVPPAEYEAQYYALASRGWRSPASRSRQHA
jgi:hypothetical protein